jgi:hypothetical protein
MNKPSPIGTQEDDDEQAIIISFFEVLHATADSNWDADTQTDSQSQQPPKQKCPFDWPPLESIPLGCLLLAVFALLFENRVFICEEEEGVTITKI